jgi:DNA-binding beta-propeller fold protein YncE
MPAVAGLESQRALCPDDLLVGHGSAAVSSDGTHVWVANYFGDTVTEMDAATGALVRVITGRR